MKYVHTFTVAAAVLTMAAQTAEARTLSFSSSSPPSAATSEVLKDWAETLKEATDGELEIEFYWQQSLSKLGDNLDAVASGLADMAVVVPAYSRQKLPLNYLSSTSTGTGDPWVISEAWLKTRKEFPAFIEEEVKENIKFLAIESIGPVIFVGEKIYASPDDFQNATMRLSSHYAFAAQNSGWAVNPARIQSPETYTSLEKGTIAGATTYANQLFPFRLNEVADFVTRPDLGQHSNMYFMNLDVWNDLSDEERAAIENSLEGLNLAFAQAEVNESKTVFEKVQSDETYPMQVKELSESEREVWSDALEPSYEKNVAMAAEVNPVAVEIGKAYKANRDAAAKVLMTDGYPW